MKVKLEKKVLNHYHYLINSKAVRYGKFKGDLINSVRFSLTSFQSSRNIVWSLLLFFFHVRSLWKPQKHLIYVYFLIKSVVKRSENSVRFEFSWKLPSRWANFWDFISQCQVWDECSLGEFSRWQTDISLIFPRNYAVASPKETICMNVKACFLEKIRKIIKVSKFYFKIPKGYKAHEDTTNTNLCTTADRHYKVPYIHTYICIYI